MSAMASNVATKAQLSALKWLANRNADGVFDKHNILMAGGERAPVMRGTWNALEALGLVEFYLNRRRLRISEAGHLVDLRLVRESEAAE